MQSPHRGDPRCLEEVLNTTVKSVVFWVAMLVLVGLVWNFSSRFQRNECHVSFSEFIALGRFRPGRDASRSPATS